MESCFMRAAHTLADSVYPYIYIDCHFKNGLSSRDNPFKEVVLLAEGGRCGTQLFALGPAPSMLSKQLTLPGDTAVSQAILLQWPLQGR